MKIASALAKIPWKKVARVIPGALGVAGEYAVRNVEQRKVDALQRIEERQEDLEKAVAELSSRIKLLIWAVGAGVLIALAVAVIALVW